MERCPDVVKIGGYAIYCSDECRLKRQEELEEKESFDKRLDELTKDLRLKDRHIERLRRNSASFDSLVQEAENKFTLDLEKQNKRIEALLEEIKILRDEEDQWKGKIQTCKDLEIEQKRRIEDLTETSKNMISTIRILEMENATQSTEIEKLQFQNTHDLQGANELASTHHSKPHRPQVCKDRILIIGSDIRGYLSLFKRETASKYDMNCQRMANMLIEDMLEECLLFCRKFTKNDFVFIFIGSQNCIAGKRLDEELIIRRLKEMESTNVILVGSSLFKNRPILNQFIAAQHREIAACVKDLKNVTYVPVITMYPMDKESMSRYLIDFCGLNEPNSNFQGDQQQISPH